MYICVHQSVFRYSYQSRSICNSACKYLSSSKTWEELGDVVLLEDCVLPGVGFGV